jgi:methyl-accepting chemotaxis protein
VATQVSIRLRLIPVSLFTTLVAILLTGGLLVFDQFREARRALGDDAETQARVIGGNCSAALLFNDPKAAGDVLASLKAHPSVRAAGIYDKEGALLASYRSDRFAAAEIPAKPPAEGREFLSDVMNVTGGIEVEGQRAGAVFLQYDRSALRSRVRRFLLLVAVVAVGALGVAYLMLARLQRSITAPFLGVARLMEEVAQGDLTGSVQIAGGGELGRLGDSISGTIANLREIVGKMDESFVLVERVAAGLVQLSEAVADGASKEEQVVGTLGGTTSSLSGMTERVAAEADALRRFSDKNLASLLELTRSVGIMSQNAESFASSAEGTTSAIHEMSASLAQAETRIFEFSKFLEQTSGAMQAIDQAVGQVKELSSRTRLVASGLYQLAAGQGRTVMAQADEGMQAIRALVTSLGETVRTVGRRSEEINAIVAIVAEIADQTNLLALNASILAAQAGEQGRGFAVVAGEIRDLSGRTEEATRRISAHVGSIQQESRKAVDEVTRGIEVVSRGAQQVEGVGAVLKRFVAGAEEANTLNEQVAERADRQAAESARVAGALVEVSRMAEQLLRSSGEQRETSQHILGIADDTGDKARSMMRSTAEQLATVETLKSEVEGANALADRLLAGTVSSRDAVGAVLSSTKVIETAVVENRSRASALREAIDQLVTQGREIRARLAAFRLGR